MLTLALDTAHDRTAVALMDGRRIAVRREEQMDRGHAERLMPLLNEALAEAGLGVDAVERIAVDVGPGSFTGIRIAVAAARGLALALDVPVLGIDSLRLIAASLSERPDGPVLAAVDARRGEVYAGLYAADGTPLIAPFAADPASVWDRVGDGVSVMAGSGASLLAHAAVTLGRRTPPIDACTGPDILALCRIGSMADPHSHPATPLYIRPPDAKPQLPIAGLLQ